MASTKQGIISSLMGTIISAFNAIIQFLTIYFILEKYGTQFNGFVRIASSFSAILATAEGATGLATIILLIKPIKNNDWITANEVYSTAKKNYRNGAFKGLILGGIISFLFPLYITVMSGGGSSINSDSLNSGVIGNTQNANQVGISYWELCFITLIFLFKNAAISIWTGVYENILSADGKHFVTRTVVLFTDVFVYTILLLLLSLSNTLPWVPFLSIMLYSVIRGFLIKMYIKKNYIWLKFYKDFNNPKLKTVANRIALSNLGNNLLLNSDVVIAALILGLNVSSTLSLYLVIGINIRLIMVNFITSFREFFVSIIMEKGRIYWRSYVKFELYIYLIAAFTFINMSILSPYFVSSLYSDFTSDTMISSDIATKNVVDYMFYNSSFSILYATVTSIVILCEAEMTLIQAKGRNREVSNFQNILGVSYFFLAIALTGLTVLMKTGGVMYLVVGIVTLYLVKLTALFVRYIYLWFFVKLYVTYNSNLRFVFQNLLILIIPFISTMCFVLLYLNNNVNAKTVVEATDRNYLPILVGVFFASVTGSIILLAGLAIIFNPQMMWGLITSLPIINKFVRKKDDESRQKRLDDNSINMNYIKDSSNEYMKIIENQINENIIEDEATKAVYKIKG